MNVPYIGNPMEDAPEIERSCVTVIGGPRQPDGSISSDTLRRLWRGLDCWRESNDPLVLAGETALQMHQELSRMDYTIPNSEVITIPSCSGLLFTALQIKKLFFDPQGMSGTHLVTADYQMKRAINTIQPIMGLGFTIHPVLARSDDYGFWQRQRLQYKEARAARFTGRVLHNFDISNTNSPYVARARAQRFAALARS